MLYFWILGEYWNGIFSSKNHFKILKFSNNFKVSLLFEFKCVTSYTSTHNEENHYSFRKHNRRQNIDDQPHEQQMQIFLNQSNNIFILAKYGQTVSLPCIIYRQNNQDLSNVYALNFFFKYFIFF